jgi:acyl carrier protein
VPARDAAADDVERVVIDVVRELVAELHAFAPPPVRLDSTLDRELGLDSMALAELLVRLDEALGVGLPTGLLRTAATPRDLVRAVGPTAAHPSPASPRRAIAEAPARSPQELTTLTASLDWHATTHPDRLHVRILGEDADTTELTYGDLRNEARAVAGGLLDRGVAPGAAVALMLPTPPSCATAANQTSHEPRRPADRLSGFDAVDGVDPIAHRDWSCRAQPRRRLTTATAGAEVGADSGRSTLGLRPVGLLRSSGDTPTRGGRS